MCHIIRVLSSMARYAFHITSALRAVNIVCKRINLQTSVRHSRSKSYTETFLEINLNTMVLGFPYILNKFCAIISFVSAGDHEFLAKQLEKTFFGPLSVSLVQGCMNTLVLRNSVFFPSCFKTVLFFHLFKEKMF